MGAMHPQAGVPRVEGYGSASGDQPSDSPRAEGLDSPLAPTPEILRPGAEEPGRFAAAVEAAPRPGAEDSGAQTSNDLSVSEGKGRTRTRIESGVSKRPKRLLMAAALSALFFALYIELGEDTCLIAASTALGLVAYWLADQRRGSPS